MGISSKEGRPWDQSLAWSTAEAELVDLAQHPLGPRSHRAERGGPSIQAHRWRVLLPWQPTASGDLKHQLFKVKRKGAACTAVSDQHPRHLLCQVLRGLQEGTGCSSIL